MTPKRVLDLLYARVKVYETNSYNARYALRLTKYNISYELSFNNENILDYWIECLMPVCVFPSVEVTYTPFHSVKEHFLSSAYIAQDKKTLQFFALKGFPKSKLQQTNTAKNTFLSQINLTRALCHPNLVNLHQVLETHNTIYLSKPYNPKETLDDCFKNSDFPKSDLQPQTTKIIKTTLNVLQFLASERIILQNLCPSSVIIDKEGKVKVVDFVFINKANMAELTDEKALTPGYIAPEIFKYDQMTPRTCYDEKSNIFSVGCIFFEMLFGFPLFKDQDPANILSLNKSYSFAAVSDLINKEISNHDSLIDEQALELLLLLLEPDFTKRVSAREALSHAYFLPEEQLQLLPNDIFALSIDKSRSDTEICSPSLSLNLGPVTSNQSAGPKLITVSPGQSPSNTNILNIPLTFPKSRRRGNTASDKYSQSALLKNSSREKIIPRKSVSFVDQLYGRGGSLSPGLKGLKIRDKKEPDHQDECEADAESELGNIKNFLDSHCIQVSMKNPGRYD